MSSTVAQYLPPGEVQEIAVHERDLICDLGRRLGCLWGYDRYIANAGNRPQLQEFWQAMKSQEQDNIDRLKQLIEYIQNMPEQSGHEQTRE
jgi:hypothetical protein